MSELRLPSVSYEAEVGCLPFDIEFDSERYAHFLQSQGATSDQVSDLNVYISRKIVTPETISGRGLVRPDLLAYYAGYYDSTRNTIELAVRDNANDTNLTYTLLHETRHFLDTVVEGRPARYTRATYALRKLALLGAYGLAISTPFNSEPLAVDIAQSSAGLVAAKYGTRMLYKHVIYKYSPFEERACRYSKNPQNWINIGNVVRVVPAASPRRQRNDHNEFFHKINNQLAIANNINFFDKPA